MYLKSFCSLVVLFVFVAPVAAQGLFGSGTSDSTATPWWKLNRNESGSELGGLYNGRAFAESSEQFNDSSTEKNWLGLSRPSWLPARDPNSPTLMTQVSEKSRVFWQQTGENVSGWRRRTSENFRNANANFKSNTTETWDRMTRGLPTPNWNKTNPYSEEPRPPINNAKNWFSKE